MRGAAGCLRTFRHIHICHVYLLLLCLALGSDVGAQLVHGATENSVNSSAAARVWLDSAFFSDGELQILKDIANQSAGALVVSGETHSSFLSVKGAYVPAKWDLYWTVRRACHSVLGAIAPPKRVNCVPGVESVAYKQPLVRTMQEAYGEAAFAYIPRSYMLPGQYWTWRSWTQHAGSPRDLPWVLKANEHRGRGVRVMRQAQAQKQALIGIGGGGGTDDSQLDGAAAAAAADAAAASSSQQKGYVLVQSYVRNQFLYDSRPSYLRLWVVVTGIRPLRAYLFRGGVLVFGDRVGASGGATAGGGAGKRRRRRQSGGAVGADRALLATAGVEGSATDPELRWDEDSSDGGAEDRGHASASVMPAIARAGSRSLQQQQPTPTSTSTSTAGASAAATAATAAADGGSGGGGGRYDMHTVNYWTIAGEKLQPWTLARLRAHVEAAQPGAWARTWAHAQASIGMVLASATKRMRASMRGLAALEGCGFEVLGVDFLLNSTFHPTLVEMNALPSLARLRLAPGDPAILQQQRQQQQQRNGSSSGDGSGGSSSSSSGSSSIGGTGRALLAGTGDAGAAQPRGQEGKQGADVKAAAAAAAVAAAADVAAFDLEKERFLQHTLRLVGMPLGTAPGRGGSGGPGATAKSSAAGATLGQVLRSFAALLRPPNNETRDLQVWLRTHYPLAVTAAADVIPQLAPLLCPVPAAWGPAPGWPVLPAASAAKAAASGAAATGASTSGRRHRQLLSSAMAQVEGAEGPAEVGNGLQVSPLQEPLKRHVALGLPPLLQQPQQQRRLRQLQSHGLPQSPTGRRGDVEELSDMPAWAGGERHDSDQAGPHRGLQSGMAAAGAGATATAAAAAAAAAAALAAAMCKPRCYEWDMLAALGDTEFELEQVLDFDHIFPMAAAAELNAAALREAAALERASGGGADGAAGGAGREGGSGDGSGSDGGGGLDIASARGGLFARQSQLQKIRMGLGFVRESIGAGAVNLDLVKSMKYLTTKPYILASTRLPYARVDAILASYETVRTRRAELCGGAGTGQGGGAGAAEVARCGVALLRASLDVMCGGGETAGSGKW
ncbi:hypothetical protein HYH02_008117 [Chlamydomonas schloesseri]|uniref:Tubulin--tyrosine ligase-like protein 5 n=1 Tax=Chlamydomonas schloesseri TaxID=2026947 RepID=A0A836B489_9CHLO|nr:hypothetical protein HYH02_008117 [Chlamydomonas schloesseri]|eukprot:KAG2446963.1 hypothetical protein HYH02_008117 [Chlamydomonas schloesseri]